MKCLVVEQALSDTLSERRALLEELTVQPNAPPQEKGTLFTYGIASVVLLIVCLGALGGWMAVNLATERTSAFEVSTATLRVQHTAHSAAVVLDATGYVVARRQAAVSSKITGKVSEILIEEGMLVEEGQLLARLDDLIPRAEYDLAAAELEDARLGVQALAVQQAQAQRDLERAQILAERGHVSRAVLEKRAAEEDALHAQVARARQAITVAKRNVALKQQVLADTEIRAPFAGIVTTKSAQPGEMISPVSAGGGFTRTGIGTIVDMQSLEVEVDVNEALIDRVHEGQPVEVVLNAYIDQSFRAAVTAIIPAADRNRATIRIRIGFLERDARVLPGMGVRASFSDKSNPDTANIPPRLLVSESAVVTDGHGEFVYVTENGIAKRRQVTTGDVAGPFRSVQAGLVEGEQVVMNLSDALNAGLFDGASITTRQ